MKKFATVLTAIVMLFATSSFAMDGDNVTAKVKAAFENDFSKARQVNWKKDSDFYFASFQLNDVTVDAAYNEDGELIGLSRKIAIEQAPLAVSLSLSQKYSGYSIPEQAFEVSFEGQTSYYITADNGKQVVSLKCYTNGDIDVVSKVKKELVKS